MWISFPYLGIENVQADNESQNRYGMETQSTNFASRHNNHYVVYVGYMPDPVSIPVDAFTLDWYSLQFYAFPPFSVLNLAIMKIEEDQEK